MIGYPLLPTMVISAYLMAWSSFRTALSVYFRRLGMFFTANILWIVLSLPIVTMPAATGALYYLVSRVLEEEYDTEPPLATMRDFWTEFRSRWWLNSKFMCVNVAIIAVLAIAANFYWRNPIVWLSWFGGPILVLLFGFLAMNIYVLPLRQIYRDDSIRQTYSRAGRLLLTYPMDSFLLLVWLLILLFFCTILAGPVLIMLFSLAAVIQSYALRQIRVQRGEVSNRKDEKLWKKRKK